MARGGMRKGAGRPTGTGQWGEDTKVLRVPLSLVDKVKDFLKAEGYTVPLYAAKVSAGRPLDVTSAVKTRISLIDHLIPNPQSTYCVKVQGDSMIDAGIEDGDMLIVDRAKRARNGSVVIANLNGDVTVKTLQSIKGKPITLMPANSAYAPILVGDFDALEIQGVVGHVVKDT